ncbi:MAG: cytoskeletal protein CcmA (bactofilin family) [Lysobacterales bacterium]|jgi:cytoskeletal protein CcmA (bactofilin family)
MFDKRNDGKNGDTKDVASRNTVEITASTSPVIGKPAVIGPGIVINGDISGTESLLIEGKVEGKISLPGHQVEVGKSGRVHADVVAKLVRIDGELKGDIEGKEKVILNKTANVRGNIVAPRVMLEDGALFKGSIDINPVDSSPVGLPLSAQKSAGNVKPLTAETAKKETSYTVKGG